jgi:outer membrane protein OmpA-like peptidoglycan-associated protein
MNSKRWTGVGLVALLSLPGVVAAQEADPPPGAAVDPPPGAAVDPPPSEVPPGAPEWGADGDDPVDPEAASGEGIPEGGDEIDTGEQETVEPSERDRSLSESNSLGGATGLMRVQSAASGAPGTFRFSLITGFYSGSGFLCPQCPDQNGEGSDDRDEIDRVSANLFLSATPLDFLEAYLGIFSHSTSTNRPAPQLKQVMGDWNIGIKAFVPPSEDEIFTFGGGLDLGFATGSGQVGISGIDSINLGLKGLATADFSRQEVDPLPVRAHVNLGYQFDNSSKLVEDYESTEGQIDRIERFSLDINRVDFLTFGLGVEGLFDTARPFLEWTIDIPTNRQSYLCLRNETRAGDSCLRDRAQFSTTPSRLSAGIRLMPWTAVPWWPEGMTVTGALDLATGGASDFLVEVAPEAPWGVWFGLGFAVDTRPRVQIEHVAVATPVEEPSLTVHGRVVEKATSNGIADALVRFDGRDWTGMISTAEGVFVTPPLDPGPYTFRVKAPGFKETTCSVDVAPPAPAEQRPVSESPAQGRGLAADPTVVEPAPGISSVLCELEAVPKVSNLNGRVTDVSNGEPIATASVRITDVLGRELELNVDQVGAFRFENVPPGATIIRVFADGYLKSATQLDIEPLQELDQRFTLAPVPAKSSFRIVGQKIELKTPIVFAPQSAKPSREALFVLEELASFLEQHPDVGRLEIQAHTVEADAAANTLSNERANAIRDALVLQGVPAAQLSARGYGGSEPLHPADSPDVRANERIVFAIEPSTPLPPAPASAPPATPLPVPAPLPPLP